MGFLDRVAAGLETRATSGLANPAGWFMDAVGVGASTSGKKVTPRNASGITALYAAHYIISEAVGGLPLKVFRYVDGNPVEASAHRSWRIIHDKPNSFSPAQRFWATVARHQLAWGNSFLSFGRDLDGTVNELFIESPDGMQVFWNPDTKTKTYRKEDVHGPREWTDETMLHIVGPSKDGLLGMSPITENREALGAAMSRAEFEGTFYKNGAVLSGWIEYPGQLNDGGSERLSKSWKAKYSGSAKVGGTPVLEEGAQFHTAQSPLRDMQFIESQQYSAAQVASMYGMPPSFIAGLTGDGLTYATVEGNMIQFSNFAVTPVALTIAKAVSACPQIFPQQNAFYAEHVFAGLLRGDSAARAAFYTALYNMNAITDAEIRALENMAPPELASGKFKTDAEPEPVSPGRNGDGPIDSPGDLLARMSSE